jgi:hypothetical protein
LVSTGIVKSGEVPVKGNGKTLGLTDGTNNYGLQRDYYSSTGSYNQVHTGSYGKDIGASRVSNTNSVTTTLGITLDSTKSGIIADTSSLTLSVNIYERTA